ncbi:MAG: hypothetical protein V3S49_05595 [Thermodesulfobacteriota bacterium]
MPEDYLPEERLLDVINSGKNNVEARKGDVRRKSTFSWANFFKIFSFKKFESETKKPTFTTEFQRKNIAFFIKVLKVVVVVLLLVISLDMFINYKHGVPKILPQQSTARPPRLETQKITQLKPPEFYLDRIKERDIFLKYVEAVPEKKELPVKEEVKPEETNQVIKEKAKNLKLVGIAWGEALEAMIEDGVEGRAYFLKEGESIGKTEVFIKKIYKDRVLLGYQDQELELL